MHRIVQRGRVACGNKEIVINKPSLTEIELVKCFVIMKLTFGSVDPRGDRTDKLTCAVVCFEMSIDLSGRSVDVIS